MSQPVQRSARNKRHDRTSSGCFRLFSPPTPAGSENGDLGAPTALGSFRLGASSFRYAHRSALAANRGCVVLATSH
jgi:hypothetical protein